MNMQKKQLKKMTGACCLVAAMGLALSAQAVPTITDVKAQQRYPWNGKFDISYTATGVDEECAERLLAPALTVYAVERTTHVTNVAKAAYLSGDTAMTNGTHKLVWDMDAQGIFQGVVSTNFEVFISAEVTASGVQLWKDGPYWAEYNVAATKPEEYGYYFCWGGTVGYKRNANNDGWVSAEDGTAIEITSANCKTYAKNYATLKSEGYIDATGNLVAAYDAATVHYGAPWRMPTAAEIDALKANCTIAWTTENGVYGRRVTGKGEYANRSIFIPAAGSGDRAALDDSSSTDGYNSRGWYWSSTPVVDDCYGAWYLLLGKGDFSRDNGWSRHAGCPVRAVRTSSK